MCACMGLMSEWRDFIQSTAFVVIVSTEVTPPTIELLRDPSRLWSDHGLRSLSAADPWYGRENAPGDAPYWRGPIWVNLNYLALSGLKHYATVDGPARERAADSP